MFNTFFLFDNNRAKSLPNTRKEFKKVELFSLIIIIYGIKVAPFLGFSHLLLCFLVLFIDT